MPEFISVSASSYDPASLATKLTELSSSGWQVVSIIPTGGDITAFLSRGTAAAAPAVEVAAATTAVAPTPVTTASNPIGEPSGWGTAPTTQTMPQTGSYGTGSYGTAAPSPQPASQTPSVVTAAASTSSTGGTPAGWYHDPSGRYELRYWDGSQWTEHVARAGSQFTDPPVA